MGDFLTNLIDRAFDRATVVQPHRAPLFAPSRGLTDARVARDPFDVPGASEQSSLVEESNEADAAPAPAPARHRAVRASHEARTKGLSPMQPDVDDAHERIEPAREQTIPARATTHNAHRPPATLEVEEGPTARTTRLTQQPSADARAVAQAHTIETIRAVERDAPDDDRLMARLLSRLPATPTPQRDVEPVHDDEDVRRLFAREMDRLQPPHPSITVIEPYQPAPQVLISTTTDAKPANSPQPAPVKPQVHVNVAPQIAIAPPAQPSTTPVVPELQAAPTIHVSIGRIEVRATAAASTAQPSRAAQQPSLSLEDYLHQRHGPTGGNR